MMINLLRALFIYRCIRAQRQIQLFDQRHKEMVAFREKMKKNDSERLDDNKKQEIGDEI